MANKKLRVLAATGEHQPNDVITLSDAEAKAAVAAGWADDAPEAVKYAESLKAPAAPAADAPAE